MDYSIENESLKITVSSKGAELTSVFNKKENRECLWNADPSAWNRHSPVLFPFVGKAKNFKYTYEGTTYDMGQHGFARDMEFACEKQTETSIYFVLTESEETLKKYPFKFKLTCGFELGGNAVKVIWKVENTDTKKLYFSIGGHPAFIGRKKSLTGGKVHFEGCDTLSYYLINSEGNMSREVHKAELKNGFLDITEDLFDKDALIVEDRQTGAISLYEDDKRLVTVKTDCPLFGVWSAMGKGNPFVCIEPWFGRCDAADFDGDLTKREYINELDPQKVFEKYYEMEF